jgi:hypothetical protein
MEQLLSTVFEAPIPANLCMSVANALGGLIPSADGFEALADQLERDGVGRASQSAQMAAAILDYEAHPALDEWGGPFNGQAQRQVLFDQLSSELDIVAIVETGTFRGTSTSYMAKTGKPVFSCELHPRYFHYSSMRLAQFPNVCVERADSRRFLRRLLSSGQLPSGPILFYLDAHWGRDLPTWDELNIIFGLSPVPVVMIDDFRVPGDTGYMYDNYGRGKCLSISDLHKSVAAHPSVFFPSDPSSNETGARRGVVVLTERPLAEKIEQRVPLLTRFSRTDALILDGLTAIDEELIEPPADAEQMMSNALAPPSLSDRIGKLEAALRALSHEAAEAATRHSGAERERYRAEFLQRQQELAAENARREAVAARETVSDLQALVSRLYTDLRASRAAADSSEEQARVLRNQISELLSSRWRKIGIRLRLARKATFE